MPKNIAIVGAGILGLTLALRYARQGYHVTLFESGSSVGGLAGTWELGGFRWDKHYHVTLYSDTFTRNLISEIGLSDRLKWTQTRTGFYWDNQLESMSNIAEFFSFSPIGFTAKFRLAMTIFLISRIRNWRKLERVGIEQWLRRISGNEVFDKIWKPLLISKLGESYRISSAAFIWATVKRMYAARSAGFKKELFGYVDGGYATVLERLSEVLINVGVELRLNSKVNEVRRGRGNQVAVTFSQAAKSHTVAVSAAPASARESLNGVSQTAKNSHTESFDAVILTCPSPIAAKMVPELSSEEKQRLSSIKYQGIVCASVLTKSPLSPFYIINLLEPFPFTGIIEMTALVDPATFQGNGLVYLPKYAGAEDDVFQLDDETIRNDFLGGLERVFPAFSRDDVLAFNISRVKYVFPIPSIGYSSLVVPPETSLGNVFLVNSSQIVNGTLNVNETLRLAEGFFANHKFIV